MIAVIRNVGDNKGTYTFYDNTDVSRILLDGTSDQQKGITTLYSCNFFYKFSSQLHATNLSAILFSSQLLCTSSISFSFATLLSLFGE